MTSAVQICNLALQSIGSDSRIASLTESSVQARNCNLLYEISRDVVLQDYDWSFARKIVQLALIDSDLTEWAYKYAYPGDCLYARRILPNTRGTRGLPFEVMVNDTLDGRVIMTDQQDAYLRYTVKITNPALFPPLFVMAMAALLGARLAMAMTRDKEILKEQTRLYYQAISQASANDANLGDDDPPQDATWIQART